MISDKMTAEINDQINAELFSEYFYMAMAAWLDNENLSGFAHFFKAQAAEERIHAMKFYDYLYDVGKKVVLKALDQPKSEFKSVLDIFEDALGHEKYITGRIKALVKIAKAEEDYAAEGMLDWFIKEQVEEENSMIKAIDQVKAFSSSKGQLYLLDVQMGKREWPKG